MSGHFDPDALCYDFTRRYSPKSQKLIVESILRAVSTTRATRFLELGIGTGRFALPILQRGHRLTGIDISTQMLRRCRLKARAAGKAGWFVNADAAKLPFENGVFDVAMAMLVLHWLPDLRLALAETRRVLRPGGCLVFYNGRPRSGDTGEADDENGLTEVDVTWQRILNTYRGNRQPTVASEEDILQALLEMGVEIETRTIGKWVRRITPRETILRIQTRSFSGVRDISDADLKPLLAELKAWCSQRFESMDEVLKRKRRFHYHVVRFQP